jgi:hypothetical protein
MGSRYDYSDPYKVPIARVCRRFYNMNVSNSDKLNMAISKDKVKKIEKHWIYC